MPFAKDLRFRLQALPPFRAFMRMRCLVGIHPQDMSQRDSDAYILPPPLPPPPLCSVIFRLREANPYFLLGGYVVRCRQHPMCPTMCVHSMQNSVRVRRVIHYGASDAIAAQLDGALISSSSKMMYTQAQQRSAHAQQLFARTRAHAHLRTRTCTCRNYDTSVWGDDERGLEDQLEMN